MENQTVNEGKTMALISYITIVGTLIAFISNYNTKNSFTSFHIRQMVGLNLLYFANQWIIYKYIGSTAGWAFGIVIFVLWIIGILGAFKGEEKSVPVIGDQFQDWFKNI